MSLDKHSPAELLGKHADIGIPYHGLATGGTLTLPNAETIPHPQPASGDVYIVRRPHWTAPERTPEQLAADAAAGQQWRDYAILSGRIRSGVDIPTNMLLGGKRLDGWIWFDPDGQPWRVRVSNWGSYTDNAARVMTLQFDKFGIIGGTPESFTRTTPPFDLLQEIAEVFDFRPLPSEPREELTANHPYIRHKLLDITQAGNKALFAAFVEHHNPGGTFDPRPSAYLERIIAIYEITIAPDTSVSAATLRGRYDCIGTADWGDVVTTPYDVSLIETVYADNAPPVCTTGVTYDILLQEWEINRISDSTPIIPRTNTNVIRLTTLDANGFGSLAPHTISRALRDIVIGAHYTAGTAAIVTASIEHDEEVDGDHSAELTAYVRRQRCDNGTLDIDPVPTLVASNWSTRQATTTISISVDGTPVITDTSTSTVNVTSSVAGNVISGTLQIDRTRNGVAAPTYSTTFVPQDYYGIPGAANKRILGFVANDPLVQPTYIFYETPPQPLDRLAVDIQGFAGNAYRISIAPWNQTTVGLVAQRLAGTDPAQHKFTDAVSRGTIVPAETTHTPASGLDVIAYPSGTYQPVTEQWSGTVAGTPPSAPDCWV